MGRRMMRLWALAALLLAAAALPAAPALAVGPELTARPPATALAAPDKRNGILTLAGGAYAYLPKGRYQGLGGVG